MFRNPWLTLVLGLMAGLILGYVFAEQQPVPPAKALRQGINPAAGQNESLPDGHPPVEGQTARWVVGSKRPVTIRGTRQV